MESHGERTGTRDIMRNWFELIERELWFEEFDKNEVVEQWSKHTKMSSTGDKNGRVKLFHCGAFMQAQFAVVSISGTGVR